MSKKIYREDQSVATERFAPDLSGEYAVMFDTLITRLGKSLPLNRQEFIRKEIELFKGRENSENNLDALKYLACLNVLYDLSLQGWIFDIEGNRLFLRMESENIADKDHIKYRLHSETDAQFKVRSVRSFIQSMERERLFDGRMVSIRNLIGAPDLLVEKIHNNEKVCEPYLQCK